MTTAIPRSIPFSTAWSGLEALLFFDLLSATMFIIELDTPCLCGSTSSIGQVDVGELRGCHLQVYSEFKPYITVKQNNNR